MCFEDDFSLRLLFEDHIVGAAGDLQGFGMLFDETVDVANALLFQYLIDSDQNTGLFYFTESVVDGSAE